MSYLDHNATTPIDPAVVDAMLPYLREHFGNPSSGHALSRRARAAVETARDQVTALLGASPTETRWPPAGASGRPRLWPITPATPPAR